MQKKMIIRRKAVESMLKEPPKSPIKRKHAPNDPMLSASDTNLADDTGSSPDNPADDQAGFESIMVSPEEKQMILEMRKGPKHASVEEVQAVQA